MPREIGVEAFSAWLSDDSGEEGDDVDSEIDDIVAIERAIARFDSHHAGVGGDELLLLTTV